VEDITSLTAEKEKRKKDLAKERLKNKGKNLNRKEHLSSHRKKFYIPLEGKDNHEAFWDQGFDISFNPAGDGNCQFAAVAHALQDVCIYRSNETLRTHQMFSVLTTPEEFKTATITGHFGFVFEGNSVKKIT